MFATLWKCCFVAALLLFAPVLVFGDQITLSTPTGVLYGTLELPRQGVASPWPVALIIAGSGPTDRDGNSPVPAGTNNSLKLLAEGLAARGIGSVRYDKRGVARSAGAVAKEADLRFDTYVDDAVLWGKLLRGDKRFASLTIIGHSEGSLIGMIAAQRLGADAFVSIAGAGRPAGQVILEQVRPQLPPALMAQTEAIVQTLTQGQTAVSIPPTLTVLFRPSVQPYLISWFRYDPAQEIKKLAIPVLIVQGSTDIQVSLRDADLLSQARPSSTLLVIPGMNHIFKAVPNNRQKQLSSYANPTLPVVPKLVSAISRFVKGVNRRGEHERQGRAYGSPLHSIAL